MTKRSSIQASAPGPDRSRKRHETIAPSNHHLPFLPVRSSRPVWLPTWRALRRLPQGEFSCHVEGISYSICSALQCCIYRPYPFLKAICQGLFHLNFSFFSNSFCYRSFGMFLMYMCKSKESRIFRLEQ